MNSKIRLLLLGALLSIPIKNKCMDSFINHAPVLITAGIVTAATIFYLKKPSPQQKIKLIETNSPLSNLTGIHKAATGFYLGEDELDHLLESGHEIDEKDMDGYTPLYYALANYPGKYGGTIEIAKLLIYKGANVNFLFPGNTTLLHEAICNKESKSIKLLLKNGARIDIQTEKVKATPFHFLGRRCGSVNIDQSLKNAKILVRYSALNFRKNELEKCIIDSSKYILNDYKNEKSQKKKEGEPVPISPLTVLCLKPITKDINNYPLVEKIILFNEFTALIFKLFGNRSIATLPPLNSKQNKDYIKVLKQKKAYSEEEYIKSLCELHLAWIQRILMIENHVNKTASQTSRFREISNYLNSISSCQTFDDLEQEDKDAIIATIKMKLNL